MAKMTYFENNTKGSIMRMAFLLVFVLVAVMSCENPDQPESKNQAPEITLMEVLEDSVSLGWLTSVRCWAGDPDGDEVVYAWEASGGEFIPTEMNSNARGSIVWWTPNEQTGEFEIKVTVRDNNGGVDERNVTITSIEPIGVSTIEATRIVEDLRFTLRSRKNTYSEKEVIEAMLIITNDGEEVKTLGGAESPEFHFTFYQDDVMVGSVPCAFKMYSNYWVSLNTGESVISSRAWDPNGSNGLSAHEGICLIRARFIGSVSHVAVSREWVELEVSIRK